MLNDENDGNLGEEKIWNKRREMGNAGGDTENWPNLRVVTKQTYLSGTLTAFVAQEGRKNPTGDVIFHRKELPDETIKKRIHPSFFITSQYKNEFCFEINKYFVRLLLLPFHLQK